MRAERERAGRRSGGQAQSRTGDTVIFSHVLYQLSYLATPKSNNRSTEAAL